MSQSKVQKKTLEKADYTVYRSIVDILMYLTTHTRLDLAEVARILGCQVE